MAAISWEMMPFSYGNGAISYAMAAISHAMAGISLIFSSDRQAPEDTKYTRSYQ
ncbi:MAG: hypothetical protein LBK45_05980 [Tannerellaceae bacterium]|nr:hypothetical protein [Tannerellaceae bacterium]